MVTLSNNVWVTLSLLQPVVLDSMVALGNFDFNVFFNYSLGNVIVNGTKLAASFRSGSRTGYNLNNDFRLSNRYTWIDPETGLNLSSSSTDVLNTYGDMTTAGLRLNEINANANMYNPASATTMQLTDYAVEKASFLRLNNITIGYSLPKTIVRRAFMTECENLSDRI